jgi:betaine reductase
MTETGGDGMSEIRVAHYLNQFYGGIGGEDKAGAPLSVHPGAVGPGRILEERLRGEGRVVATLVCGDNAFHEGEETVLGQIVEAVRRAAADVLVAGPAFASGRYGLACTHVCARVQSDLGLPAVTGLHPDNPAVRMEGERFYAVATSGSSAGMSSAMEAMARLALRLARREPIGSAREEGYLPRGVRRNARLAVPAAARVTDMLLAKLAGRPYETELSVEVHDRVAPAPALGDLRGATIAVVTEAGLVPKGNPDRIEAARATRWASYSLEGVDDLQPGDYESVHGGYDNTWVHQDPDRVVPWDALRALEREGSIGRLHPEYFVTCGSVGNPTVMRRIGREMAARLVEAGVHGVIAPAT